GSTRTNRVSAGLTALCERSKISSDPRKARPPGSAMGAPDHAVPWITCNARAFRLWIAPCPQRHRGGSGHRITMSDNDSWSRYCWISHHHCLGRASVPPGRARNRPTAPASVAERSVGGIVTGKQPLAVHETWRENQTGDQLIPTAAGVSSD